MFPDPKKMFDSTHEENEKAYGKGSKDASKAGVGESLLHDLEDTVGKFFPDNRQSKYKSYDQGWRDNAYRTDKKKDKKQKSTSNINYGSSGGDYNDPTAKVIGVLMLVGFLAVVVLFIMFVNDRAIFRKFADRITRSSLHTQQQTVWTVGMVNTQELNVRSEPGANSKIVGKFKKGARLAFTGNPVSHGGGFWIRVSTDDGKIQGWANKKFISP